MNYLVAKVKREFKRVLSKQDVIIDNYTKGEEEHIVYDPNHKPEEDEWFCVNDFTQKEYAIKLLLSTFSHSTLNQIIDNDYSEIKFLLIYQGNQIHIQRVTSSKFVNHKRFLDYSGQPKITDQKKQIEIKLVSDAVFFVDTNKLIFKDLGKLKSIFPGIAELHREATEAEVIQFLAVPFIVLGALEHSQVGTLNRKRIAEVQTKYLNLTPAKKQILIQYAKENAGLDISNDKIKLETDNDLKNLLYAMDQRYYYADIYEEKRIATSTRIQLEA